MDQQMNMSIRVPIFDGEYYVFWKIRMKIYLMSIGLEVWELVGEGYDVPKFTPTETEDKKKFLEHAKDSNTLKSRLSKKVLSKVLNCGNENQCWDKLETIYARYYKVKRDRS